MESRSGSPGLEAQVYAKIPPNVLEDAKGNPLIDALHVTSLGYFPHARYHYRRRDEGCDQHILIYCVKGTEFVRTPKALRTVEKDHILVIPKGLSHVYGCLDREDPWTIYWVHYAGNLAPHYNPGPADDLYVRPVPPDKTSQLVQAFRSMIEVLERGATLPHVIYVSQALAHVLATAFYLPGESHNGSDAAGRAVDNHARVVNDTIAFMRDRLTQSVTLNELAHRANLSKSHFSFIFKQGTGHSPIDFFIRLKMQHALRYLDLTDMTIQQVAFAMGFKDPYYFSRLFTRVNGISPSEYRRSERG